MGRPVGLSRRRLAARHQVHGARRRLRRRDPRHPEGGPALAGDAPAAPRADAGLVGGRLAAGAGGAGRLAMAGRQHPARPRRQRADRRRPHLRHHAVRSRARISQPAGHAGRSGAQHPQAAGGDAGAARRLGRNHLRTAPPARAGARRAVDHAGRARRRRGRAGSGRARPRASWKRSCGRTRRTHATSAILRSPSTASATRRSRSGDSIRLSWIFSEPRRSSPSSRPRSPATRSCSAI